MCVIIGSLSLSVSFFMSICLSCSLRLCIGTYRDLSANTVEFGFFVSASESKIWFVSLSVCTVSLFYVSVNLSVYV